MLILHEDNSIKLNECMLLLPSVSVGNIGQLVVDLLITNLQLKRIGFIRHKNIPPAIGTAVDGKGIATECELFASENLKIAVVQIRSSYGPFVGIASFMSELCQSFKSVVIMSGAFAFERKSIYKLQEPMQCLITETFVPGSELPKIPENWNVVEVKSSEDRISIPGSGIGDHLFNQCKDNKLSAALLAMYVSEGDNREDAQFFVNFMNSWLNLREERGLWLAPSTWDTLLGSSPPANIF